MNEVTAGIPARLEPPSDRHCDRKRRRQHTDLERQATHRLAVEVDQHGLDAKRNDVPTVRAWMRDMASRCRAWGSPDSMPSGETSPISVVEDTVVEAGAGMNFMPPPPPFSVLAIMAVNGRRDPLGHRRS